MPCSILTVGSHETVHAEGSDWYFTSSCMGCLFVMAGALPPSSSGAYGNKVAMTCARFVRWVQVAEAVNSSAAYLRK